MARSNVWARVVGRMMLQPTQRADGGCGGIQQDQMRSWGVKRVVGIVEPVGGV